VLADQVGGAQQTDRQSSPVSPSAATPQPATGAAQGSSFDRGLALLRERKFADAIPLFAQVIAANAKDWNAYVCRGDCYRELGNSQEALKDYDTALKLTPKCAWALASRAELNTNAGNQAAAIADSSKAIEYDRNLPKGYFIRGVAYYRTNLFAQSLHDLNIANGLDPKDENHRKMRSLTYSALGRYQEALADMNIAIALNPQKPGFYHIRGVIYGKLGDAARAQQDFDRCVGLNPHNSKFYYDRSVSLQMQKKTTESFVDRIKALRLLTPKDAAEYKSRATSYLSLKQYPDAISDLTQVIRMDPDDYECVLLRGNAYECSGQLDKSIADYTTVIEAKGRSTDYACRGHAYMEMKSFENALSDYSKAIQLDAKNANLYIKRASIYSATGSQSLAVKDKYTAEMLQRHR
jgi:tetratricopeptide (TPR) repeat protein